ncbi:MAG: DUF4105 domain-containing protein [Gemmatimonadaceae bacterium]|nr:DUF4105 domain-containing protein [Gemmatimonadaceae bacterium]
MRVHGPRWFARLVTRRVAGAALFAMAALGVPNASVAQTTVQTAPDNVEQTPPPPAPGKDAALDSARARRGESMTVSIYTYGPGDQVFERFGHIALAIRDTLTGEDLAFNWGMFDFAQPNFLSRFLTGDTKYWMAGYRTMDFNTAYRGENRTIREQRLVLTPAQRGALYDFVAWKAQEANKYYRYDYYNDNCSTRVRDAIDWALGGALQQLWSDVDGHHTWRDETARITADNLPVYAGIQIALGRNADKHLTRWQMAFLPEHLADALVATTVNGQPLVAHDSVLYVADRAPMPEHAPQRLLAAGLLGLVLALLIVAMAVGLPRAAWITTVAGSLWYGVGGVLGTALLLAGTVTKHVPYMGTNLSLTVLSPLLLVAAAVWFARARSSVLGSIARGASLLIGVIAILGLIANHVPGYAQGSMVVILCVVPVHLALAFVAWRSGSSDRASRVRA